MAWFRAPRLDDAQKNYERALNKQEVSKAKGTLLKAKIRAGTSASRADRGQLKQLRTAQLHR